MTKWIVRLSQAAALWMLVMSSLSCGGSSGGPQTPQQTIVESSSASNREVDVDGALASASTPTAAGGFISDSTQYVSYASSAKASAVKRFVSEYTRTEDNRNGDVEVSACFRFDSMAPADRRHGILMARSKRNSFDSNAYQARILSYGGLRIYKQVNGKYAQLGGSVGAGALAANVWYQLVFNCNGSTLSLKCRRLLDGRFLQPGGSWAFSEVPALQVSDTSIVGAGYAGYGAYQVNAGSVWVDEFRVPRIPESLALIVTDGNSMTDSRFSTYPAQMLARLGSIWTLINPGVNAQTTQQMRLDAAGQIDPLVATGRRNVVVAWEMTNELRQGADRAGAYQRYQDYCRERRAAGFSVVAVTILPRSQRTLPATFEADRSAINADMRKHWSSFADALADVAADKRIGDAGDQLNPTFYRDAIHPTVAGYDIVAGIIAPAVIRASLRKSSP